MRGWDALAKFGTHAAEHPFRTAGSVAGSLGLLYGAREAYTNPIETAGGLAIAGSAVARHGGEVAIGAAGTIVAGIGMYGAGRAIGRSTAGKWAGGKLGAAGKWTGQTLIGRSGGAFKAPKGPGSFITGPMQAYGGLWDKAGWKAGVGVAAGLGVAFGAAKAAYSMGMERPQYESAVARSVEGSAYEQGPGAFGKRSSRVATMGSSTANLVQGLHNSR